MNKSHAAGFSAQFSDGYFPPEILRKYIPLELLAETGHSQTFLMQDKQGGGMVAAKRIAGKDVPPGEKILSRLSHAGLPAYLETVGSGTQAFLLRAYVPGMPLDRYAQRPVPEKEAVRIAREICAILSYLHGQAPPVIHRDLKPSNIIIDPNSGKITLIDFGIARTYDAAAKKDTVFMGTHEFSPPEQYGFAQTDGRADIYALGVLLCWLLTGGTQPEKIEKPSLKKIVRRCTAFDPARRYKNVLRVRRDLRCYDKKIKRKIASAGIAAAVAIVFFTGGFVAGRYTQAGIPVLENFFETPVVFSDPLLEEKVRAEMGVPEGVITTEQAGKVTSLDLSQASPDVPYEEKIKAIGGLEHFKNLKTLYLDWNQVEDISPLYRLKSLEALRLNGNGGVNDYSPLAGMTKMKDIMFVGCQCTADDLLSCAGMTDLESFWVESTFYKDVGVVQNFPNLRKLVLKGCAVRDISPVASLVNLREAQLQSAPVEDFSPLLSLPNLGRVVLGESQQAQAEAQLSGAIFEIVYE